MRDPELLLSLLKEMAEHDMGRLTAVMLGNGHEGEAHRRHHHVELLVDAGHAEWQGDQRSVARITNAGYDFLNAVTNPKRGKEAWSKFVDRFNSGVSYVRATQSAVDFASGLPL